MIKFTDKDYNSNNGMMKFVWGPLLWDYLHMISFNYPINPENKQKKEYINFMYTLGNTLPCKTCRENYKKNLKELKFSMKDMQSRETFSKFIWSLHDYVNKQLNKPKSPSYNYVKYAYEHFRYRDEDEYKCDIRIKKIKK